MKKKLIVGLALLVVGYAAGQMSRTPLPVRTQTAHAEEQPNVRPIPVKRYIDPNDPNVPPTGDSNRDPNRNPYRSPFRDPSDDPTPLNPNTPRYVFSPSATVAFFSSNSNPTDFENMMSEVHRQLSEYLNQFTENKIVPPAKEVQLQRAVAKYLSDSRFSRIVAELEKIVEESPGTDEAKRASVAVEALKAKTQPPRKTQDPK